MDINYEIKELNNLTGEVLSDRLIDLVYLNRQTDYIQQLASHPDLSIPAMRVLWGFGFVDEIINNPVMEFYALSGEIEQIINGSGILELKNIPRWLYDYAVLSPRKQISFNLVQNKKTDPIHRLKLLIKTKMVPVVGETVYAFTEEREDGTTTFMKLGVIDKVIYEAALARVLVNDLAKLESINPHKIFARGFDNARWFEFCHISRPNAHSYTRLFMDAKIREEIKTAFTNKLEPYPQAECERRFCFTDPEIEELHPDYVPF